MISRVGFSVGLAGFAFGCHEGEGPQTPHAVKEDTKKVVHEAGEGMEKAGDEIQEKTERSERY